MDRRNFLMGLGLAPLAMAVLGEAHEMKQKHRQATCRMCH
jgi:hypothetical protein